MRKGICMVAFLLITTVAALAAPASLVSRAAPAGLEITVVAAGTPVVMLNPGCLGFNGQPADYRIIVKAGAWVSNGFDPSIGWITLVSSGGEGNYRLTAWQAQHICVGSTVEEAYSALAKWDPGAVNNPRVYVTPAPTPTPTATATATTTPLPTATAKPSATPTPGTFSSVRLHIATSKGIQKSLELPACLSFNPDVEGTVSEIKDYSGVWASNGREGADGKWETIWGANPGVYVSTAWAGFNVCGGRTYQEAMTLLATADPGAAGNIPRRVLPVAPLFLKCYLPQVLR